MTPAKLKKLVMYILIILSFYFTVRITKFKYDTWVYIPKTHPEDVWEFVADFSNMKYLNPTIIDFNILNESGNYEHWKYSVEYTEKLSGWPYAENRATAYFDVQAMPKQNIYYIQSTHKTCFLFNFFCLNSESKFTFSPSESHAQGTLGKESIVYECPWLLSLKCKSEVAHQRQAIMSNLKKKFVT